MPETPESTDTQEVPGWGLPVTLVLLIAVLLVVCARLAPPAAKPATAPAGEFSAGRARAVLAEIVGEGKPHPVGSAANAAVRERVVAVLRRLGYTPQVESGYACTALGNCAAVQNVVAELPGREPGTAVALVAHYDSVGAGPGVSDDLAGVASILEIARILKAEPQPKNSVLLLLDEGEEAGLLGARAFEERPEASRVKAVVNLEARGTEGQSLMFETAPDNAWLLPLFHVPNPATSSLFITLYEFLPNDTDFSVFKAHGISGFNFAYIGGAARYHTPLDDLKHLSSASLQHHGDNGLATTRALAQADLAHPRPGRAVFFDLLGLGLIWWPAGRGVLLAGLALLLLVVLAVRLKAARRTTIGALLLGMVAVPLALVAAGAVAFAVAFLLRLTGPGLRVQWPAHALPAVGTFWLLAIAVTAGLAGLLRRARFAGLWTGIWLAWALVGLLLALCLPGVSYLFLVPALAAGLCGLLLPAKAGAAGIAAVVSAGVAAVVWFPILFLLYDGLGTGGLLVVAALLAVFLTAIVPLVAAAGAGWRRGLPVAAAGLALLFAVAVAVTPVYSLDVPRRMNLVYHLDGDGGTARFLLLTPPPVPPAMRQAAKFGALPETPFPWSMQRQFVAPAPALPLAAPALVLLGETNEGGKRHLRLRLTSPRGGASAVLVIPKAADLQSMTVAGHEVPSPATDRRFAGLAKADYRIVAIDALPAEGVEIEAVLGAAGAVGAAGHQTWTVLDGSPGLPPAAAALAAARPANASSIQDGDRTMVSHRVQI
ncbi:MAG TPA: M28 family peptidase [Thermoanaerobaculia bacterium]|nr:M28 family peptidase [Thermoanaerobaculia bacterium]